MIKFTHMMTVKTVRHLPSRDYDLVTKEQTSEMKLGPWTVCYPGRWDVPLAYGTKAECGDFVEVHHFLRTHQDSQFLHSEFANYVAEKYPNKFHPSEDIYLMRENIRATKGSEDYNLCLRITNLFYSFALLISADETKYNYFCDVLQSALISFECAYGFDNLDNWKPSDRTRANAKAHGFTLAEHYLAHKEIVDANNFVVKLQTEAYQIFVNG